ncbi:YncE family protein [Candidatus Enterococcus murrayae]|uniref:Uncharacterized protein n=1 Tax=Candidatus Enterococcus murrayae TaxID=2815321 RepID=A0ABS3HGE1_9ENTE|nr:hypothetical protein [Enterococcus sp. MJM16]MBO0452517.1 hypothetical protein [Enterococcus sp. MJM16]
MKKIFSALVTWLRHFLSGTFYNRKNVWRAFPEFFEAAAERTYRIPDLESADTLSFKQEKSVCPSMTPQGMTLTENYVLISAYCHDHRHNSVIHVLDRLTGLKLKTIILPDLPHAGGLAYDPIHQKIWISNTAGKNAAVTAIALEQIEEYTENSRPINYQQKNVLKELPRASAITYDHGFLVVALFALNSFGQVVCYPIDGKGNLANPTSRSLIESPFGSLTIPPKVQGVTFYKNFLLFSQSWGKQPGQIFIFDIRQTTNFADLDQAVKIIATPPYLEQIYVEGDQLYTLFESGAAAYRKKTSFVMKDILQLDLLELLK